MKTDGRIGMMEGRERSEVKDGGIKWSDGGGQWAEKGLSTREAGQFNVVFKVTAQRWFGSDDGRDVPRQVVGVQGTYL